MFLLTMSAMNDMSNMSDASNMSDVKYQRMLILVQKAKAETAFLSQQLEKMTECDNFEQSDFVVKESATILAQLAKSMLAVHTAKIPSDMQESTPRRRPVVGKK